MSSDKRIIFVLFSSLFVIAYCNYTNQVFEKIKGDIIISAMFPITVRENVTMMGEQNCAYFPLGISLFEAFRYAVKKVNDEGILKGMTLGYDVYDTCSRVDKSVEVALDVLQLVKDESVLAKRKTSKHIAVIGAGKSELSITVNDILSTYNIPQVGYASTSKILSNKYRFPTFSRTVPTDISQAKVIANILKKFEWTYAMLVYTDDNYGRPLYTSLLRHSEENSICFAEISMLPNHVTDEMLADVVEKWKKHDTAGIVVVFLSGINSERLIEMAKLNNISKKVWVFTATWYNVPEIFSEKNAQFLDSSIGVIDKIIDVPKFDSYFTTRVSIWRDNIAEAKILQDIKTKDNIEDIKHDNKFNFQLLAKAPYVINAVLAVVDAINIFCAERFINSTTNCQKKIKPSSILPYLKNTNFKGITEQDVFLDKYGDSVNNTIDIYSFQHFKSDASKHVLVGAYNGSSDNLTLYFNKFNWSGNIPPISRCSNPCPKGMHRVINVMASCCWKCIKCPFGTFSNESNSVNCRACTSGSKPNQNQTGCEIISYIFMRWNNPWAIVISMLSVISTLTSLTFFLIFCYYRSTPVVRAYDCEFSLFLLLSITIGLSLPLMYPGEPTDFRCRLQDVLPAVVYSLTLSIIIAKTKRTAIIFSSKSAANIQNVLVRRSVQFTLVLLSTSTQLMVCLLWLSGRSPSAKVVALQEKCHLLCDFNSIVYFLLSKFLLMFLNTWCIAIALSSRRIPGSYNNSRHTLFALLTFKLTWLMGIIGRFYGQYGSIVDSLTILISYSFLLHLMFSSKIYVLLFRKDLNNQRVLRERAWEFTLRKQSTSLNSLQLSTSMLDMTFLKRESIAMSDISKRDKGVQTDTCLEILNNA
ncbi:extracellular calcium-sensing receptor-like [Dendronephthya gigantea]|uniref:extracellular calcium-sensing receptor-like n=1 Tax=Dendronephthya gigantea TaxID=151771 RepID=UPI00106CB8A4|nr:extracellular calcium-sensing receptor-like [Dendronephthya gigantea]